MEKWGFVGTGEAGVAGRWKLVKKWGFVGRYRLVGTGWVLGILYRLLGRWGWWVGGVGG